MVITPDARAMLLESLAAGCSLADACRAPGVRAKPADVRAAAATDDELRAAIAVSEAPKWSDVVLVSKVQAELAPVTLPKAQAKPAPSKGAAEHTDDGQPDWQAFRDEAAELYGPGFLGLYRLQDDRLVARGFSRTSPWWLWTISLFFASGLMWLLALVGRGGGKSTTLARLAIIVTLFAPRAVPPGEAWQWIFMSVRPKDANRRLHDIKAIMLAAYAVTVTIGKTDGIIETKDAAGNNVEFISVAGTVGNMSGPSSAGATIDEAAKLQTNPLAANQDIELIVSLAETSRARDHWYGVRCSSAYETRGAHFASINEGTNLANYVATIGPDFIGAALDGFEIVARWEAAQGNSHGATQIRAFAKTLTVNSPNVPTWVANDTIGALASRLLLATIPKDSELLEGLDPTSYWLRENGSMPLAREGGADYSAQCLFAAELTARLSGRSGGKRLSPGVAPSGLTADPYAKPGEARYAGPMPRARGMLGKSGWRGRKVT